MPKRRRSNHGADPAPIDLLGYRLCCCDRGGAKIFFEMEHTGSERW